ncbi:MAG: sulfotransferase domain-containing protein [Phycisphaerae bacterium]|nr:sulfotransferase domain-containing protein [Phycisphaerae bacterium]
MIDQSIDAGNVIFGCAVEAQPRSLFGALRLAQSLRWFGGGLSAAAVGVCVRGDLAHPWRDALAAWDVNLWAVDADAVGPEGLTKAHFLGRKELADYDLAVAVSPFALVCADPSDLLDLQTVVARPCDAAVFADDDLAEALGAAGLAPPEKTMTALLDGRAMGLFDTAVVSVPTSARAELAGRWRDNARRLAGPARDLTKRADTRRLSRWNKPLRPGGVAEQLALAAALTETDAPAAPAPVELNCPATYPSKPVLSAVRPSILRYQPPPPAKEPGSLVHYYMPRVAGPLNDAIDGFNDRLARHVRSDGEAIPSAAAGQIDPPACDPAAAEASGIRYKPHDRLKPPPDLRIMIGASPRTGNNWLSHLLTETYGLTRVFDIGGASRLPLVRPDAPFVLYQHILPTRFVLDWGRRTGVMFVTMVRNPADVFLSFYHMANAFHREGMGGNFNKQPGVEGILGQPLDSDGVYVFLAHHFEQLYTSLFWVLSERAIVVRYEDLHADTADTLAELTERIRPVGRDRIDAAVAACSKDRLRAKSKFMQLNVRRGQVGESAEQLNEKHFAILRDRLADELGVLGYEL